MPALGAAVEARRIDRMPGGPQPVRHRLPNPAALVRAVDQNKIRHLSFLLFRHTRESGYPEPSATPPPWTPAFAGPTVIGSLIPAGYVDCDAGHEIGVARGEKANDIG